MDPGVQPSLSRQGSPDVVETEEGRLKTLAERKERLEEILAQLE